MTMTTPPDLADDLANRFGFHPATTEKKRTAHETVRSDCLALARKFDADLPRGRELSLAITKLEEAMFWANAALAREGDLG